MYSTIRKIPCGIVNFSLWYLWFSVKPTFSTKQLFIRERIKNMAIQHNNADYRRRNPIKRNAKFFSKEDFDLEIDIGKEYLEQDAGQTVILYEVDLNKTKVSDIYKEAQKAYQETLKKSKIKWKDSTLTTKMKALKQEFFQKEQAQITTKTQDFQTRQNLILSQTKDLVINT